MQRAATPADVVPVATCEGGVALESSFAGGIKREMLRSLGQVINDTSLCLEVALAPLPSEDWLMLPTTVSSASVRRMPKACALIYNIWPLSYYVCTSMYESVGVQPET